ncbi:MAG: hypothetical protein AAFX05_02330 [Planctomycetota bacterium]
MQALTALVVFTVAGTASASHFQSVPVPGLVETTFEAPGGKPGFGRRVLTGDTVDVAVTAFSASTGAFLSGPTSHTVGGTDTLPTTSPGLIPDHQIETSVMTVGLSRTLTIQIFADDALSTALAPAGLTLNPGTGPEPLISVFFEMPEINGGPDRFDDPEKITPASGTFNLLGTGGAVLFTTSAGINDAGTSFSVGNGVNAGGGDIFDPFIVGDIITGGSWTITYRIPTPASASLLGIGALILRRRR